jgi:hypothetical protein
MNDTIVETILQSVLLAGWIGMFIVLGFIRLEK